MAKIKKFRKKKGGESKVNNKRGFSLLFIKRGHKKTEGTSLSEKILRHRLRRLYRLVLIVAVIALISVFFVIQTKNRVYEEWITASSYDRARNDSANILSIGESILLYSNDGASCLNKKGEVVWNQTFEMQNPVLDICGNTVAIGDYNGHNIYLMNEGTILGMIDTGMPIRSVAASDSGIVAAVLDDSDNVNWIYLYDKAGEVIAYVKATLRQNGYPLKIALSENGVLLSVSYLYMDSREIRDSVAFYNFGSVGQNVVDHLVSGYDYKDAVIPFVKFIGNGRAVSVGDKRITFFEGDQKPVSVSEVLLDNEIRGVYTGEEYAAIVYHDITGEALYKIDIYDKQGKVADTIKTDIQFKDVIFKDDRVMIYSAQECIYHTVGGVDNFRGRFPRQVRKIVPQRSSNEFVAVTSDKIEVLRLR